MKNSNEKWREESFHLLEIERTIELLNTSTEGLSEKEAEKRLEKYGKNEIEEKQEKSILKLFLEQFKNIMIIILIAASIIAFLIGEFADAVIIFVVVLFNAVFGVAQEKKAEKSLQSLRQMTSRKALVRRDSVEKEVEALELVPGDVVLLDEGDYVPADLRLIETATLKINEAALTGESVPREKTQQKLEDSELPLADKTNLAFAGTSVTSGRGTGVVIATGNKSEIGTIAKELSKEDFSKTLLQQKLDQLSKYITIAILGIVSIIFISGIFYGRDYYEMFMITVSLAVAAIPQALPAVITVILAIGVQKMAKNNAIITKLSSVETLGSTQVICTDKTGTLTRNKMEIQQVFLNGEIFETEQLENRDQQINTFMQVLVLCNDVRKNRDEEEDTYIGDPTEVALVEFASKMGVKKEDMEEDYPRKDEIPFDSDRKMMTTINKTNNGYTAFVKGAPEAILKNCTHIMEDGEEENLTEGHKSKILDANDKMADQALRNLAFAINRLENLPDEKEKSETEEGLIFIGLVGMIDPPREEVKEAVNRCKEAGIKPIMITGDQKKTAFAIARELDFAANENEVIESRELNRMNDEELVDAIEDYSVFARISPKDKVRIVKALKRKGLVVAMTGDGVNDAPALKEADISISMGIAGTDVAKGVSKMVLADDNFATIVVAVEEGRKIFNNITKTIQYLLSANMGEVITVFVATMLNWRVLLPIHILWINLISDTLPALALGVEKPQEDLMNENPRGEEANFFSRGVGGSIIYQGIAQGCTTLLVYYWSSIQYSHDIAMTMAFATLGMIQLIHAFNVRSTKKSIFHMGIFTNIKLVGGIVLSAVMLVVIIIVPQLNDWFSVQPLSLTQWSVVLTGALSIIPIVEIAKFIYRKME